VKLVLFQREAFLSKGIKLGDKNISTVDGLLYMERDEKEAIIDYSRKVYREVLEKTGFRDFKGHVRVDLVPKVTDFRRTKEGYSWKLGIGGIYEINANAPECGAATAALHHNRPELALYQPDPAERMVEVLNGHVGEKTVAFVIGKGVVKREWGRFFMGSLYEKGLKIKEISPREMGKHDVVWRFGDVRSEGYTEFPPSFREELIRKQEDSFVLNSVPRSSEEDIGNKAYLLGSGERSLETEEDILWALGKKDLVAKPYNGASGKGIVFQRNCSKKEWEEKLRSFVGKGYGLYRAKWLPKLEIDEIEQGVAMDISPSFMANGERLDYLYTIARVENYESYINRGTINVAQGAGFVGTLVDYAEEVG